MRHETRIQCRAEGFPRPTIHWSEKGEVTDVIFSEATSQSTLIIRPTERNSLGYDTRSFVLVQHGKVLHSLVIHLLLFVMDF